MRIFKNISIENFIHRVELWYRNKAGNEKTQSYML